MDTTALGQVVRQDLLPESGLALTQRPPVHPTEHAYPCCLPALGEFGTMSPHEGLPRVYVDRSRSDATDALEQRPGPDDF